MRDIAAGEERTSCYYAYYEGLTRLERHGKPPFPSDCDCKACRLGTTLQRASEMRRRLIRALIKLSLGRDKDTSRAAWLITVTRLREVAGDFESRCHPCSVTSISSPSS